MAGTTVAGHHDIYDQIRQDMAAELWWPAPELLTWPACVIATARRHDRNPGEYGRRL